MVIGVLRFKLRFLIVEGGLIAFEAGRGQINDIALDANILTNPSLPSSSPPKSDISPVKLIKTLKS